MRNILDSLQAGITRVSLLCFTSLALMASAQGVAGKWEAEKTDNGARYLSWNATVPLLGKPTKVNLAFRCDLTNTKEAQGTLGFDLYVHGVAALKPFAFDDFEGPDATAGADGRKLMELTVARKGKAPLVLRVAPSGFTPHMTNYGFGVADVSKLAKSDSRTLLTALANDDAESLKVSITDPKNAKLKLEFTVPVAGKQADFRTLIAGLK